MKSRLILIALLSLNIKAQVPNEVKNLLNKPGTFYSTMNGKEIKAEIGTSCKVKLSYGTKSQIQIESKAYFTPYADFHKSKKKISSDKVIYRLYTARKNKHRYCSYDVLLKLKKTVEITDSSVKIIEDWRCLLGGKGLFVQMCREIN